ncbi:LysR substrate-binding domain-containing protein [Pollutimonas sp. M17]|uniref:LysR substrate-binding domain-containing protein n=1 Tax=Pollutimonas sp. M17 TaxID=2962065 RepID=UPI0021F409A3|nr:LysR substrate-binding domain-containing protein [Pollutimonas sp. M17]UYO92985.1 LysR substrate-binding domain-containing protein [Pollutimonas sp. M17]
MTDFDSVDVVRKLTARLKMRHLQLLLRIRQHGSLTRVAEEMSTSQPAVTNALAEVESMFGAPLFDRSARGMSPTALGEVALARAQAMINDLGNLVRDMETVASGNAAHLHIGVIPFISGQMLSTAVQHTLPEGGGRLTLTIHEGTSDQLMQQLRDHTLDIAVGRPSTAVNIDQLEFEALYDQQPRLVAGRRLAAQLGRRRLNWRQLARLDWILGAPGTPIREQVSDIFLKAGVAPPAPIIESYATKLMGELIVSNDQAVSIVPADIADELVRIAGVAIVPYSFDWTLPPIALFTRRQGPQPEAVRMFARALRVACKQAPHIKEREAQY